MSDLLVSLIESLAGAAAAAAERRRGALGAPPRPSPAPPLVVKRARPRGVEALLPPTFPREPAAPSLVPGLAAEPAPTPALDARTLFVGSQSLLRAIVAAELLGRPIALRTQNLWDAPSV